MSIFMTGSKGSSGPNITLVEYLEATGSQYIDTGIKPTSDMSMEIKFSTSTLYYNNIACVDLGWQTTGFGVGGNAYQWGTNVNSSQSWADGNTHVVVIGPSGVTLDGSSIATFEASTWTIDYPLALFALNRSGEIQENCTGKIWYAKVYNSQSTIAEFVSAIDAEGVACMYDKVSKKCFYNLGSGEFTAG